MRSTGAMKGEEARGGGGGDREGRGSDVAHRQELARLTHDHTHACTHALTHTGMYIHKFICIYIKLYVYTDY